MKVPFPFPTSRNNELRGGSGLKRIEQSIQEMAEVINDGNDALAQAVEAAETAASTAMSGTPEGYSDVLASIAEEFSAEKAYSAGAIVWRNSKLYAFTADHAAGAWSGTDAEEIAISTELTDLNSTVTKLDNQINADYALEWQWSRLFGASGYVSSAKWGCAEITGTGKFKIHVPEGFRYQLYAYVSDSQGTAITPATTTADGYYNITSKGVLSVSLVSGANLTNTNKATIASGTTVQNADTAISERLISVESGLSDYDTLSALKSTNIPTDSDLNDYTTIGNYKIASSIIANATSNIPVKLPGKLSVLTTASTNNIVQIYIDSNGEEYKRTHDSRGWSYWDKITYNSELTQSNTLIAGLMGYINAIRGETDYNIAYANATKYLPFTNYLGNTQNIHPKVLYFPDKFSNHYYWMSYTPYPNGNDLYENPCIAYSDDGYNWVNISNNPIDDASGTGYNSDPHLVYNADTNKLECWYRYVNTSRTEIIYRKTSSDGLTWSAKEQIISGTEGSPVHYLSPAIIYDGTNYNIWVIDNGVIKYYTAAANSVNTWALVRTISITFTDDGASTTPWHLDVINDNDTFVMLVMCRTNSNIAPASKWSLFITSSADNTTYTTPSKVIGGSVYGWDRLLYRSSIVKVNTLYKIYYSGLNLNEIYGMSISESETLSNFIGKLII